MSALINISGVQAKANRNTKDLEKREKELDKREKALAAREAKLASSGRGAAVGTDVSVSAFGADRAEFCKLSSVPVHNIVMCYHPCIVFMHLLSHCWLFLVCQSAGCKVQVYLGNAVS